MDNDPLIDANNEPILPVIVEGIDLLTEEEFYKVIVEKILHNVFNDLPHHRQWIAKGCFVHVAAVKGAEDNPFPLVRIGRVSSRNTIGMEYLKGLDVENFTFNTKQYIPDSSKMTLPLVSIAISNDLKKDPDESRASILAQITYTAVTIMTILADNELSKWQRNSFPIEVLFDSEIYDGPNSRMSSVTSETGILSSVGHWIE